MVNRWYRSLGAERNFVFALSTRNTGSEVQPSITGDIVMCGELYIIRTPPPETYQENFSTRVLIDELTITR